MEGKKHGCATLLASVGLGMGLSWGDKKRSSRPLIASMTAC